MTVEAGKITQIADKSKLIPLNKMIFIDKTFGFMNTRTCPMDVSTLRSPDGN